MGYPLAVVGRRLTDYKAAGYFFIRAIGVIRGQMTWAHAKAIRRKGKKVGGRQFSVGRQLTTDY